MADKIPSATFAYDTAGITPGSPRTFAETQEELRQLKEKHAWLKHRYERLYEAVQMKIVADHGLRLAYELEIENQDE